MANDVGLLPLRQSLFLAWGYLKSSPVRTVVLVLGVAVAIGLPVVTRQMASLVERTLLERARSVPLVIGAKGNEFDLVLSSLYFRGQVADPIPLGERRQVEEPGYGLAVPMFVRYAIDGSPVVGTTPEYYEQRGLRVSNGRLPLQLGEVVAGAQVASDFSIGVGDRVRSDLTNLYNLAGAYPTLLDVVGVLATSGGPDDDVFFADIKTTWVLDGRIHGHQAVTADDPDVVAAEGDNVEASAAIFLFSEITDANRASFHGHGDADDGPVTGFLAFPRDRKSFDLLLGDYALRQDVLAIEPQQVIRSVLGIVLRAREILSIYFGTVAVATVAFLILVLWLSIRLRRRELALMRRIGCSRFAIASIVGTEIALVLLMAVAVTAVMTAAGLWLVTQQLA